jgi:hypothetical protein
MITLSFGVQRKVSLGRPPAELSITAVILVYEKDKHTKAKQLYAVSFEMFVLKTRFEI